MTARENASSAVWLLSACFAALMLTTNLQFSSLQRHAWGFYPQARITSIPFVVYFLAIEIATLRSFVKAYRASVPGSIQKMRARILLFGFAVGYLGAFDFIISLGMPWRPLAHGEIFVFLIISSWAILHYRFMAITPAFAAREIIDTMNDALIVLDSDGVVRLVNRATCTLFGCREQDLVGKRPGESAAGSSFFAGHLESFFADGTVRDREVDFRAPEDALRTLSLSTSIMRNPAGETLAVVCVVSDISDRKRAEQEREELILQLQKANEQLQTVDKMKSDFVSMVSHELRTPLATIKAFAELTVMKPDMPAPERTRFMGIINAETDRLSRLISDVLDLSRIEAGSMRWRFEEVSIDDVIKKALAVMGPLFERKSISVTTSLEPRLSGLSGDRDRLVQVVTNILSNAVKFTPRNGSIRIAARRQYSPREEIIVEISDTGIGIDAGDLELIFKKFQRSRDESANAEEGSGLGLAIAREIIEHHSGRIWAESRRGSGSMIIFTLPVSGNMSPGRSDSS